MDSAKHIALLTEQMQLHNIALYCNRSTSINGITSSASVKSPRKCGRLYNAQGF